MRLGTDPEFFVLHKRRLTAICGKIGADKWDPLAYDDMPPGFNVVEDNVAVEFGVPPASSAAEFISNVKRVKQRFLRDFPELTISTMSAAIFPEEQLQHAGAQVFGCEPDYNAWTKEKNPKPSAANPRLRSAGGHVHVETDLDPWLVGRAMDLYLGVPSVLMDTAPSGKMRRELYGKHGAMRVKPYGLEYRTLSNWWCHKDRLGQWVWDSTAHALENAHHFAEALTWVQPVVADAIDKGDANAAKFLVNKFNLEVV